MKKSEIIMIWGESAVVLAIGSFSLGCALALYHSEPVLVAVGIFGALFFFLLAAPTYPIWRRVYFREMIGLRPPSKKDWQAMKLVQILVENKAKQLKDQRAQHFKEEEDLIRIEGEVTPEKITARLKETSGIRPDVLRAKEEWEEFKGVMKHFGFNV